MQQTAGLTTATCMNMHFIEHVFVSLFYGNKKKHFFLLYAFGLASLILLVMRKRVSELVRKKESF